MAQDELFTSASAPFSQESLNQIFQVSTAHPDRLVSRESGWLEFKSSFNWAGREQYARTIAAFANNRGGYIVFGVKEKPHVVVGVDLKKFNDTDPSKISEYLNNTFGVEIAWEAQAVEFLGKNLVIFHVPPAARKPVFPVASGDRGHIQEGEIYYRYRGRTQKIRHAELTALLDAERKREQAAWLRLFRQIAKAGIHNVALLDLVTGKGTARGANFLVDESLLSQLKFVREGDFTQKVGAAALKVMGEVSVVPAGTMSGTSRVTVAKVINAPDILRAFLRAERVPNPLEYIDRVCHETSAFLPIYYFAHLAGISKADLIARVSDVRSTSATKKKLLERLTAVENLRLRLPVNIKSDSGRERSRYLAQLRARQAVEFTSATDAKHAARAVRSLDEAEIDFSHIAQVIESLLDSYYGHEDRVLSDEIRRAAAYLDCVLYRGRIT